MERAGELILRSLSDGPRTLWDLVAEQNTQHRRFCEALTDLLGRGLVASDEIGNVRLTAAGSDEAGRRGVVGWRDRTCPTCGGRGVVVGQDLDLLVAEFRELTASRPDVTTEFDQGFVPPEVAFARLALMEQRGDLAGKDLLLLGDDDLMSVALMLRGLTRRVVVLEIDERVVAFLEQVVARRGWRGVEVRHYDARQTLPSDLVGQFDVFFTDPVETVAGIGLFLSRCAQALRGDGTAGYFGLTHIESGWAKWLAIERAALQMSFAIAEVLADFNRYVFLGESVLRSQMKIVREAPVPLPPPNRLWFSASVFRLQAVGTPMPLITGSVDWGKKLYADEDTI